MFRKSRREGKRERETSLRERYITRLPLDWLSHAPNWGPGQQPRHVPCVGIELLVCWLALNPLSQTSQHSIIFFSFIFFKILFLERGEGRQKERQKHQCVVASHSPHTGDLACNPGMCPDWASNQRPFGLQAGAQSTEPHQPGLNYLFLDLIFLIFTYTEWLLNVKGDLFCLFIYLFSAHDKNILLNPELCYGCIISKRFLKR